MTDNELYKEMKKKFGSFGEVCFQLCRYQKEDGTVTDRQIEEAFEHLTRGHRKCFNKKGYISFCREPK